MKEKPKVMDRGALYYPFIHVKDENWLKATLLCFPFVDRMVPDGYEVNDNMVAAFFAGKEGRFGRSMLGRRDLGDPATEHARSVLLENLRDDVNTHDLSARLSREAANGGRYADGENAFQIHEYKLGGKLFDFLQSHSLTWEPTNPVRGNARWWAVHPILGETIMCTNAVALAKAYDLEIVTSNGPIHQALLGTEATEVYDILIRQKVFGIPRTDTGKVNDLMRFIFVSSFDLENLSLEDIAELNKQRSDLSALKSTLLSQVDDVGAMPDQEVWHDVLEVRAREALEEWGSRKSVLSMFSSAGGEEITSELKSFFKEVAPTVVAGGVAMTALVGALPGLAVGVVFGTAHLVHKWQKGKQPYRFLSLLEQRGARFRHVLEGSPV